MIGVTIGVQKEYFKVVDLLKKSYTGSVWNSTYQSAAFDYIDTDGSRHEVLRRSSYESNVMVVQ
jgi:hypothetical protein